MCPIVALHHNVPLANRRKNQVIADALGAVWANGSFHPLVIEIKVSADDCWYALVQNLQQVRMVRSNPNLFSQSLQGMGRGAWGMVLAPREYYEKHAGALHACRQLLQKLKRGTELRSVLASSDLLGMHEIGLMAGNWG